MRTKLKEAQKARTSERMGSSRSSDSAGTEAAEKSKKTEEVDLAPGAPAARLRFSIPKPFRISTRQRTSLSMSGKQGSKQSAPRRFLFAAMVTSPPTLL